MRIVIVVFFFLFIFPLHAASPPLKELTILLEWYPNPDHAPLIVAEQEGFFKAHGLSVKLIAPTDPLTPPKLVAASQADIAITYAPEFLQQVDNGLPLIVIGTLVDQPLACAIALKKSGIKTIADFKGKSIGTNSKNIDLIFMLKTAGLTLKDVELITIQYNMVQALLTHNIDIATQVMRNYEVPQLELNGHPVNVFLPENYGIPTYSELVFVANIHHQNDPRITAFLSALTEAVAYLKKNPEKSWEIFAKLYPESNNTFTRTSWFITIPYFNDHPAKTNAKNWEKFATFMQENGLIKKVYPMDRYLRSDESSGSGAPSLMYSLRESKSLSAT